MGLSKNRLALNPLMNHQYPFDLNMKNLGAILQFWTDSTEWKHCYPFVRRSYGDPYSREKMGSNGKPRSDA